MLINCDLGEGFGAWQMGSDDALMPHIHLANLACGFHAGDPEIMQSRLDQAAAHNVRIGAHVSYPDLAGFGRRALPSTTQQVVSWCLYQYGSLLAMAQVSGLQVEYVKPHGALYHRLHQDLDTLRELCLSMKRWPGQPSIMLLAGPAGAAAVRCAEDAGLYVVREAFADRAYQADGSLRGRSLPGAVLESEEEIRRQVEGIRTGSLVVSTGETINLKADSICIHSDSPNAVQSATLVRSLVQPSA